MLYEYLYEALLSSVNQDLIAFLFLISRIAFRRNRIASRANHLSRLRLFSGSSGNVLRYETGLTRSEGTYDSKDSDFGPGVRS